jgi:beta-xylosidase
MTAHVVRGPRLPVGRHGALSRGDVPPLGGRLRRLVLATALLLVAALLVQLVQLVQLAVPAGLPRAAAAATFAAPAPWRGDLPDPHVVAFGGRYYAYGTTTAGANVPVVTGVDLVHWVTAAGPGRPVADALPVPARWAARRAGGGGTEVWAPSVARLAGRWVMHYAVLARTNGRHCISVATASSPLGPFTDTSARPLVCSGDPMGSIDPTVFTSGGVPFLIWKNEGVPHRAPTRVWARALTTGGTGFARGSSAHELLHTALRWEGDLVEGPSMLYYGHRLYLFYSANAWDSARYATGYAVCRSVLGPCRRITSGPLLASAPHELGPGGPSAFLDGAGRLRLAFHAWGGPASSYPSGARTLHVARLSADRYGGLHVVSR